MLIINTEIGGIISNSYASLAEANTYHMEMTQTDTWDNSAIDTKEKALVMATRLLDERAQWKGTKKNTIQTLFFPAYGLVDKYGSPISESIIPCFAKDATCEFSRHLIDLDFMAENDLEFVRMPGVAFKFNQSKPNNALPSSVLSIINFYIKTVSGCVRLVRC